MSLSGCVGHKKMKQPAEGVEDGVAAVAVHGAFPLIVPVVPFPIQLVFAAVDVQWAHEHDRGQHLFVELDPVLPLFAVEDLVDDQLPFARSEHRVREKGGDLELRLQSALERRINSGAVQSHQKMHFLGPLLEQFVVGADPNQIEVADAVFFGAHHQLGVVQPAHYLPPVV